jgi:hypothetical protein
MELEAWNVRERWKEADWNMTKRDPNKRHSRKEYRRDLNAKKGTWTER